MERGDTDIKKEELTVVVTTKDESGKWPKMAQILNRSMIGRMVASYPQQGGMN